MGEKIRLEEQLEYLKLKEIQSDKVLEETENKLYEKNMEFIKLENELKKLKIIF